MTPNFLFLLVYNIVLGYFILNMFLGVIIAIKLKHTIQANPTKFNKDLVNSTNHPFYFIVTVVLQSYYNLIRNIIILLDFHSYIESRKK